MLTTYELYQRHSTRIGEPTLDRDSFYAQVNTALWYASTGAKQHPDALEQTREGRDGWAREDLRR